MVNKLDQETPEVALAVPARFRLVIEGPLEHQTRVLAQLKRVAHRCGCIVIARAERAGEAAEPAAEVEGGALSSMLGRYA